MKNLTFFNKVTFLENMAYQADRWDWSRPMVVKLDELRRKEIQSRLFHALCDDVSRQVPWADCMRTKAQWKHLLVSGHSIATKEDTEFVVGLEGEMLNIRESTASMTIKRMNSLIEYATAWAINQGVKLKAPDYYDEMPESKR